MNRLAIFDCDGTLVDSGATIFSALRATLTKHGIAVPSQRECRRVIGLSLGQAMERLVPHAGEQQLHSLSADYKAHFMAMRAAGQVQEPLYDGVLELLDRLESGGWLLAVATGKSDRGLKHCLDFHDIHARFVSLQTCDRHPSKPHPSMVLRAIADAGAAPETTIVVGDTSFDMAMAAAAGARGIGAGWGYHDSKDLLEAGALPWPSSHWTCSTGPIAMKRGVMRDEELWRRRFRTFMLVRLAGLAVFLLGIVIATTDLLREGGWPLVGAIVAIMGLVDALFAPRMLKKVWEQEDARR